MTDTARRRPARVVVLGGGTGGTLVANRLRRAAPQDEVDLVVVDQDDVHLYQPGLLFVPFAEVSPGALVRRRSRQLSPGIRFLTGEVRDVDLGARLVHFGERGDALAYDVLVIATGARLARDATPGYADAVTRGFLQSFYTPGDAEALADALGAFAGGRMVIGFVEPPIKCPSAPLEFCFLADTYLRRRNRRRGVDMTFATPLDAPFRHAGATAVLSDLLAARDIRLVTNFHTVAIDGATRTLLSEDGRRETADLAVVVPAQRGAPFVATASGLGDAHGFVVVDPHTLQARADPAVFAIGDAAALPTDKSASVAHFSGAVVAENVLHFLRGEPVSGAFDGRTSCIVETGEKKAVLVESTYDGERRGGRLFGPLGLPVLGESRLNHLAKRASGQLYWHVVLPGREIRALGARSAPSDGTPPPKQAVD